jgi:hypothetical protein
MAARPFVLQLGFGLFLACMALTARAEYVATWECTSAAYAGPPPGGAGIYTAYRSAYAYQGQAGLGAASTATFRGTFQWNNLATYPWGTYTQQGRVKGNLGFYYNPPSYSFTSTAGSLTRSGGADYSVDDPSVFYLTVDGMYTFSVTMSASAAVNNYGHANGRFPVAYVTY